MTTSAVRFECATCGWRHDVPTDHIVRVDAVPRSDYIPYHECDGGADVSERSSFEAEWCTTMPVHNVKIRL